MRTVRDGFESRVSTVIFAVGALLFVLGCFGIAFDVLPTTVISGPGMRLDVDLELLGVVTVGSAVLTDGIAPQASTRQALPDDGRRPVYITRALLETLFQFAGEHDPESISVRLAVTPAERLTGAETLAGKTPVFTHLYLPEHLNAASSVFGVDLQTPPGRTHGRFVTHPLSDLRLTKRDDLHEIVFVAVPPWDRESVAAFDRRGRRQPLRIVDAVPPDESLPGANR